MNDNFYKAFEDRYRGARAIIKARLTAYLPFIAPLAALHAPARALDLGCGRGEWLELVQENGFTARGVDLDDGMLSACRALGLDVETQDALAALRALPDASVALVSAFHLVEHIAFDDVQALIAQALRVLQPGGLLIMETPNPENLTVGAHSFYRDPSHLRPLPPELLQFAAEFGGFARQRIMRLQEDPALRTASVVHLQQVLEGVSPDYAVVAQKAADADQLQPFDAAFGADFGLSFETMARRFDEQGVAQRARTEHVAGKVAALDQGLAAASAGLAHLESNVVENNIGVADLQQRTAAMAEAQAELAGTVGHTLGLVKSGKLELEATLDANKQAFDADTLALNARISRERGEVEEMLALARGAMEHRIGLMEQRNIYLEQRLVQAESYGQQLVAMTASRSWRITAPLRAAGQLARRLRNAIRNRTLGAAIKRRARGLLQRLGQRLLRNRTAKGIANALLVPFPRLRARLRGVMASALLEASAPANVVPVPDDQLSPRSRQLYQQLQQAFKQEDQ